MLFTVSYQPLAFNYSLKNTKDPSEEVTFNAGKVLWKLQFGIPDTYKNFTKNTIISLVWHTCWGNFLQ